MYEVNQVYKQIEMWYTNLTYKKKIRFLDELISRLKDDLVEERSYLELDDDV